MDKFQEYTNDIEYLVEYYQELNPNHFKLALLASGYRLDTKEGLRYLELGCGLGFNLNVFATVGEGNFYGNDFNLKHVEVAKKIAGYVNNNVKIFSDSFEELAARDDLPPFDIIVLNGVWSHVSDANREHILNIVDRNLAKNGIFYLSYYSTPGSADWLSLINFMSTYTRSIPNFYDNVDANIDKAIALIEKMSHADNGQSFLHNIQDINGFITYLKNASKKYLAHEISSFQARAFSAGQISALLKKRGLTYACDAIITNKHNNSFLPEASQQELNKITDEDLFDSMRDYFVNRALRKDVWIKGGVKISEDEKLKELSKIKFMLRAYPKDDVCNIYFDFGYLSSNNPTVKSILNYLKEDDCSGKTIGDILNCPSVNVADIHHLLELLLPLCNNYISPVFSSETPVKFKKRADKFNHYLLDINNWSEDSLFLISPAIGGAVAVPRVYQLFILGMNEGYEDAYALAEFAYGHLTNKKSMLVDDTGKPLTQPAAIMNQLVKLAGEFLKDDQNLLVHLQTFAPALDRVS